MIATCLKFTARPGDDLDDDRFAGVSLADRAALEVALRLGEALHDEVLAVTLGPRSSERVLRDSTACGVDRVLHIECPADRDSRDVAFELAHAVRGAAIVTCGDQSSDRGSGSVPAFVAHHIGAAQALGLVRVDVPVGGASEIRVLRRLDGGRREVLDVPMPCVLSVEGSVATLRRAGLRAALLSSQVVVERRPASPEHHPLPPAVITPFRPRARALPAPIGTAALARLRILTDAIGSPSHGELIELGPRQSAERIADALTEWGFL
jgi:electron transfer flavoprotein beta subunit